MYPYINIFGITIGSYGVCMLLGIVLVCFLAWRSGKTRSFSFDDLMIVSGTAVGCALVGGVVLYALVTYSIEQIIDMICAGQFDFLKGIVFYGGLIGGVLGAFIGKKIAHCKFSAIEECIVPFIPLGHAIGRVGCLLAGCCYGCEYEGPLAVYYPNSMMGLPPDQGYFPTPLLEAVLNIGVCILLVLIRRKKKNNGDLLMSYLGIYGIVRMITEMFRGDEVRGKFLGVSTSQWVSIALISLAVAFFVFRKIRNKKAK